MFIFALNILVTKGKETDLQPMKGSSLTDISDSGKTFKIILDAVSCTLLNTKVPVKKEKKGKRNKGQLGPLTWDITRYTHLFLCFFFVILFLDFELL